MEERKTKYIVQYDRIGCIGAAACVAALQEAWEMDEEGKAILKGENVKSKGDEIFELEITEEELEGHMEAAKACPVVVIHITNKETGEKLI
ncbi:MAG: ferredoxin [Candidatus Nanoarchaeia archaeon]|jgi:ferredoxin|nr:ferredoxin [Candidatus Nanoarchaeia archaeon]|tara:strand:+ start:19379 stop:19651 length:273 start_codon:yes stop_codon:yes gene_type:complete